MINIGADSPAAFVWLETTLNGRFEENGFLMNTPHKYVNVKYLLFTVTHFFITKLYSKLQPKQKLKVKIALCSPLQ